ncbi:proteasome subunit beta [Candidatus Pacearchaeota archaeon]|nr:proteasome subunit beta [Candidatus Pacearchaeota archaeon]
MNPLSQDIEKNIVKSGTSIVGIVCKDGVVLAGDRRTTAGGQIVMSKRSDKVIKINDYIAVAGTGVSSDIDLSQRVLSAELRLKDLKTKSRTTVKEAANLYGLMSYRNIRTPSMIPSMVGTLLAGVNEDGSTELYTIEPAGGVYKVEDYDANFGSGMPYILGLLERQYKKDMSVKDAVELAKECIKAAMERDPASGNGIDVFAITKEGVRHVVSEVIVIEYK